jgi:hypothetical protein
MNLCKENGMLDVVMLDVGCDDWLDGLSVESHGREYEPIMNNVRTMPSTAIVSMYGVAVDNLPRKCCYGTLHTIIYLHTYPSWQQNYIFYKKNNTRGK